MKKFIKLLFAALLIALLALSVVACDKDNDKNDDNPDNNQTTEDPVTPDKPYDPGIDKPDLPDKPNDPDLPDRPSDPDTPDKPDEPGIHEHSFGEWEIVDKADCTRFGMRRRFCSCGEFEEEPVEPLGHDVVEHEAKPVTCTEAGWDAYETCTRCDYSTFLMIYPDGHDYAADYTIDEPATCSKTGIKSRHCKKCDRHYDETVLPKLAHTPVTAPAVEPTCTQTGLTEGTRCSVCNEFIVEQNTIPALGHDPVNHEGKEPTCTESGYSAYETCSRCDYSTLETIPALGHNESLHEGQAPTCTEAGWADYMTCSRCDFSSFEALYPLGHDFGNGYTVDEEATCANNGVESKYCSRCSLRNYIRLIPKTAHNIDGESCTVCGYLTESVYYQYNEETQTYAVSGRNKSCTVFEIAEKYDDGTNGEHAVTSIADEAFYGAIIYGITIPETVTSIGQKAFYNARIGCKFVIPSSVNEIGSSAFSSCNFNPELGVVYEAAGNINAFHGNSVFEYSTIYKATVSLYSLYLFKIGDLKEVTITAGDTLTNTHNVSFGDCRNLKKVTITGKAKGIFSNAFSGCTSLTTVIIDGESTYIGENAFKGCTDLTDLTIGDGVKTIGAGAFNGCTSLTGITANGVSQIGENAFNGCTEIKNFVFGGNLSSIGSNAFLNCQALKNFYFNGTISGWCKIEGLESLMLNADESGNAQGEKRTFEIYIGSKNFGGEIVIPEGIEKISDYAFYSRDNVTSVVIPEGVTSLGRKVFTYCFSLKSVTLPSTLTDLSDAFLSGGSFEKVYFNGNLTNWLQLQNHEKLTLRFADDTSLYIGGKLLEGELVIPEGITKIDSYTFYGYTRITEVTLPEGLTEIGSYAFANCTNIERLYLPDGLTEVMEYAFNNTSIGLIYIPETVTYVGNYAFGSKTAWIYCKAEQKPTTWGTYWNYNKNSTSGNSVTWNLTRAQFEEWFPDNGYPAEVYRKREGV